MLYILLSALSSICVALLLKQARIKGIDSLQLIGWNYACALVLCLLVLQPSFPADIIHQLPWHWLSLLAVLLPAVFIIYSHALNSAGVIATEIAQRLSLVIALLAAFMLFGDQLTLLKFSGATLGIMAVLMLISQPAATANTSAPRMTNRAGLLLFLVWVGYGVIDVLLKTIAQAGVAFSAALTLSFSLAFVGMLVVMVYRHYYRLASMTLANLLLGALLGTFNFANISLYIKAHQLFSDQPAVVFASMNILVVVMGTLAGACLYKEPLKAKTLLALAMSLGAIGLLSLSRWIN
jgi:drug/metabolite transporter (DMT)-like permease